MKKKFALGVICLGVVIGFQNCNHRLTSASIDSATGVTNTSSSSLATSESEAQSNVVMSDQEIISGLEPAQPGESCDSWLQRNGVAAAVKNAYHTYDGTESKWGQGGVNENKACAMMIYNAQNKAWSCTAGSSSHIDQFESNPALWSYPVVSCNDGVRSVRTAFSGLTVLSSQ